MGGPRNNQGNTMELKHDERQLVTQLENLADRARDLRELAERVEDAARTAVDAIEDGEPIEEETRIDLQLESEIDGAAADIHELIWETARIAQPVSEAGGEAEEVTA